MKIGIDIRTLIDAQYSGVPEYTRVLLKEIFKLDKESEYKLFYNSARDLSKRIPVFDQPNIKIVKTRWPNKIFNYGWQNTLKWPKIDEMLGVNLFFMPHINFIALGQNAKKILTVHDLSFLLYPEFFSWRKNIWHRTINARRFLRGFDTIVAVSENTRDDIVRLTGVDKDKVRVIYSGIDKKFKPLDKANAEVQTKLKSVKEKYQLPDKFVLYLGTLEPRKNVEGIIEAFDVCRQERSIPTDCGLVIAGGRGWRYKNIYQTWQKSKQRDSIHFTGYLDEEDKVFIYNLAEIFVYPSFYEGFGFPPLEAMACGIPTVLGANSSLAEVAGWAGVLVDAYNIREISAGISQIFSDSKLNAELKKRSIKLAAEYRWSTTAKQYLELFAK